MEQRIHDASATRIPPDGFGLLSDEPNVIRQVVHISAQASQVFLGDYPFDIKAPLNFAFVCTFLTTKSCV